MAFNYPQTSDGSSITIPSDVQYAIGVDGINVKVLPAGSTPNVVYRIGDGTTHPEGFDNVDGNKYLDFYISTGSTGAAGADGEPGASAYTQAVNAGYTGTESEFWQIMQDTLAYIGNINTVGQNISDVNDVADDITDVSSVAGSITKVNTVADDLNLPTSNIETVSDNISDVSTVSSSIANVNTVAGIDTNITTVAGISTNIGTVAGVSSDVTSVANISSNVSTVAGNTANINTIATDIADVTTVATDLSGSDTIGTVSTNIANVNTVAGINGNISTVAGNTNNINTVATNITNVNNVGTNIADVNDVADDLTNIGIVATDLGNYSLGSLDAGNITGTVSNVDNGLSTIVTVGTNITDVQTVAGIDTEISFLATNWNVKQDAEDQDLSTTDDVEFNSVTTGTLQVTGGTGTQGEITWNADEETVDLIQNGATLQLGQETQVHCRNNTGSTINNGTVVMATGTLGASGRITVAPYDGTTDVKYIIGVSTEDIADGEDGKITNFGKVRKLDTSSYSEGDVLYVAASGALTATEPTSGVYNAIAFVINQHATNGTIMVRFTPINENKDYGSIA